MASDMGGMVSPPRTKNIFPIGIPQKPDNMSTRDLSGFPAPTQDPFYNKTTLLIHGSGTVGSNSIIDYSPVKKPITANGNSKIAASPNVFGGSSLNFAASSDYLSFSTAGEYSFNAPFTAECWAYMATSQNGSAYFTIDGATAINIGVFFSISSTGKLRLGLPKASAPSTTFWDANGTTTIPTGVFNHLAASMDSSFLIRLFLNGKLDGTLQVTSDIVAAMSRGGVVARYYDGTSNFTGNIEDMRITTGTCRYTADFIPPVRSFSDF